MKPGKPYPYHSDNVPGRLHVTQVSFFLSMFAQSTFSFFRNLKFHRISIDCRSFYELVFACSTLFFFWWGFLTHFQYLIKSEGANLLLVLSMGLRFWICLNLFLIIYFELFILNVICRRWWTYKLDSSFDNIKFIFVSGLF